MNFRVDFSVFPENTFEHHFGRDNFESVGGLGSIIIFLKNFIFQPLIKINKFKLKKIYLFFNWWKIALQFCVGFCCTTPRISHNFIYISPPLPSPHPAPLGHHRALGWASCVIQQLPTIYFIYDSVYIYQRYFFNSSHLTPPLAVSTNPFSSRFIITIFLDSIYMH